MQDKPSLESLSELRHIQDLMADTDDIVEIYLAHYGVKGMKWGVVKKEENSAPKPVSEKKQAKRDRRAQKYTDQLGIFDKQIRDLKQLRTGPEGSRQNKSLDKSIRGIEKEKARALADAEKAQQGKLTSDQKRMIIGAAVVVGLIALKAGEVYVQSGEFNRQAMKGQNSFDLNNAFKKKSDLARKDLTPDQVWDSVAQKVNPDYGALGTKMNCRRCTFAYELRRRGYDVEATRTTTAHGQNAVGLLNALTPGEKIRKTGKYGAVQEIVKDQGNGGRIVKLTQQFSAGAQKKIPGGGPASIFHALSQEPDGSRGELGVMWAAGGGHSMAYEIFKGQPVIFDAQTGQRYSSAQELSAMRIVSSGFTRLDNVDLNTDYLLRWLKNAK